MNYEEDERIDGPLPDFGGREQDYLWKVKLIWDSPSRFTTRVMAVVSGSAAEAVKDVTGDDADGIIFCCVTRLAPDSYELISEMRREKQSRYKYTGIKDEYGT